MFSAGESRRPLCLSENWLSRRHNKINESQSATGVGKQEDRHKINRLRGKIFRASQSSLTQNLKKTRILVCLLLTWGSPGFTLSVFLSLSVLEWKFFDHDNFYLRGHYHHQNITLLHLLHPLKRKMSTDCKSSTITKVLTEETRLPSFCVLKKMSVRLLLLLLWWSGYQTG